MKKCVCDKCNKIVWLGNSDDRKHGVLCSQCSAKRWTRKNHPEKRNYAKSNVPSNLEIIVLVMRLLKMVLRILK